MTMPKGPKDLPSEDQPDYAFDALLKRLGLMHTADVVQADGDFILLKERTIEELRKAMLARVDDLVGTSADEIEAILQPIVEQVVADFDEDAAKHMKDHFGRVLKTIRAVDDLPCAGQTSEQVRRWIEANPLREGDAVAIRTSHGGIWEYRLAQVEKVNHGRQRRIIVENHGAFYRNGKNCYHPKGQVRLIEPTADVRTAAETHTTFGILYHHLS